MAITTRSQAKGSLNAVGVLSLGRISDNFPYEASTPSLGTIFNYVTTGTPSSLSIQFEGSQDGATGWTVIGAALTSATSGTQTMLPTLTFPFVRANLTAIAGGTSPTVVISMVTQGGN